MPPLARNIIDTVYIEALTEWIDNFDEADAVFTELLVYPNPTNQWLNVRMPDDWSAPFQLTVYSMTGQKVHQESGDTKSIQMDLSNLSGGTYFLEISAGKNREVQKVLLR